MRLSLCPFQFIGRDGGHCRWIPFGLRQVHRGIPEELQALKKAFFLATGAEGCPRPRAVCRRVSTRSFNSWDPHVRHRGNHVIPLATRLLEQYGDQIADKRLRLMNTSWWFVLVVFLDISWYIHTSFLFYISEITQVHHGKDGRHQQGLLHGKAWGHKNGNPHFHHNSSGSWNQDTSAAYHAGCDATSESSGGHWWHWMGFVCRVPPKNKWTWKWHGRITLTWRSRTERNNGYLLKVAQTFLTERLVDAQWNVLATFQFFSCASNGTRGGISRSKGLGVHCRAPGASWLRKMSWRNHQRHQVIQKTPILEVNIAVISGSCRISQDHHLFVETALRDVGMHTPTTMMRMLIEWHQKIMGKDCLTETTSSGVASGWCW